MVMRDMKLRYKRSVMGIAWSLLNPLAQLAVFGFVFRFVLPLDIPNYTAFLFIGILAWSWFQGSLQQATGAIVENGALIGYPGFPVAVLPVVTVTSHLVHYLLALPIVVVFLLASGISFNAVAALLPVVVLIQFVLSLSLAFLVATLQVFFRDTQYLLGIALMLGFFLTPIFYDLSTVPARFHPFYRLNPMYILVEAYRDILVRGILPDVGSLPVGPAVNLAGADRHSAGFVLNRKTAIAVHVQKLYRRHAPPRTLESVSRNARLKLAGSVLGPAPRRFRGPAGPCDRRDRP